MTRLSLLGVLAIGATLVVAPAASAKPIGQVSQAGVAAFVKPASHAPAQRCAHNGASTNKAGHRNCRRTKGGAATGTGDPTPVTTPSTGDGTSTDTPPTTAPGSDQGDQNDQGSASGDQGDQNDQGDQGDQGSSSGDQGDQNDQGSSSGDQGSSSGDNQD